MGAIIEARREEAERQRGYFAVQLQFAEIYAERTACRLADACLEVTNLHRRFGLGRAVDGAPAAGWSRYAEGLERRASGPERLDWTLAFFAEAEPAPSGAPRFGCFSYEMLEEGCVVKIHFNNRDSDDDRSPLDRAKADRRRAELGEMIASAGERHPQARLVRGASWLYNLEAYRRLFPPAYVASIYALDRVRLDGTSSWGQVLDFRGAVKPQVAQAVLAGAAAVDVAAPWTAFPLRPLGAEAPIEAFQAFYGR